MNTDLSVIFEMLENLRRYNFISMFIFMLILYIITFAFYYFTKIQKQKRRKITLNYIKRWNDLGYQTIFSQLYGEQSDRITNKNSKISHIIYEKADSSLYYESLKDMEKVWNFFEELALAIIFKEADEEMAREFFIYSVITTYRMSEKAFYKLKEKYNNKALYNNFERLVGKWTTQDLHLSRRLK